MITVWDVNLRNNVFKFDKKELLKTPNKQEYEREKLQAQQTLYLGQ